jgi:hypothetical protein
VQDPSPSTTLVLVRRDIDKTRRAARRSQARDVVECWG